jgi:hypothetical protein
MIFISFRHTFGTRIALLIITSQGPPQVTDGAGTEEARARCSGGMVGARVRPGSEPGQLHHAIVRFSRFSDSAVPPGLFRDDLPGHPQPGFAMKVAGQRADPRCSLDSWVTSILPNPDRSRPGFSILSDLSRTHHSFVRRAPRLELKRSVPPGRHTAEGYLRPSGRIESPLREDLC